MPYTKKFESTLYDEKWLRHHYRGMRWSANRIARLLGCTTSAVLTRLRAFGIPVRSMSQVQRLVPHPGSHAPRPKKCRDTLHNPEWLRREYETKNASDIARELGVAVPSVIWALKKAGISPKTISEAKKGRPNPKRRVDADQASYSTLSNRAKDLCPRTPCAVCGKTKNRMAINHKDRDHAHNVPENLEWLCPGCHTVQHRVEEQLALRLLVKLTDITMTDLHERARRRLQKTTPGTP